LGPHRSTRTSTAAITCRISTRIANAVVVESFIISVTELSTDRTNIRVTRSRRMRLAGHEIGVRKTKDAFSQKT
jgi:hypothetical protein